MKYAVYLSMSFLIVHVWHVLSPPKYGLHLPTPGLSLVYTILILGALVLERGTRKSFSIVGMKYVVYLILSLLIMHLWYSLYLPSMILEHIVLAMVLVMGILVLERGVIKSFSILVTFPLFVVAMVGFVSFSQVSSISRYDEIGAGVFMFFMLVFFMIMVGMFCAFAVLSTRAGEEAGEDSGCLRGVIIVMAVFGLFFQIVVSAIMPLLVFLLAPIPAILGTMVTSMLTRRYQYIVLVVLGLWSVFMIGGWVRLAQIDDGLDTFVGQDLVAAEKALRESRCNDIGIGMYPSKVRVVKDESGEFRVLGYTWWGLPPNSPSCGPYRQGNRW